MSNGIPIPQATRASARKAAAANRRGMRAPEAPTRPRARYGRARSSGSISPRSPPKVWWDDLAASWSLWAEAVGDECEGRVPDALDVVVALERELGDGWEAVNEPRQCARGE
jgi:hypothetical protein